jgi:hypothetical protein
MWRSPLAYGHATATRIFFGDCLRLTAANHMESLSRTQPDSEAGPYRSRPRASPPRRYPEWRPTKGRPELALGACSRPDLGPSSLAPLTSRPAAPRDALDDRCSDPRHARASPEPSDSTQLRDPPPRPAGGTRDRRVRMRRTHCAGSRHQNDARRVLCGARSLAARCRRSRQAP